MSSRKLALAADARLDSQSILRVRGKAWGRDQRGRYRQQLTATMNRLTEFPNLGRRIEPELAGIRAFPVGQHVLCYQLTERTILIVRVVHAKMDAAAHLADEQPRSRE